jgi:hypothetical protein
MTEFDEGAARTNIAARQALRRENHLPLLDETTELARMRPVVESLAFEQYLSQSPLYRRAMRRGVRRYRHQTPHFMFGMMIANHIRQGMRKRWLLERSR